jgi:sugar phosphate isomerase/epimerase
MRVGLMIEPFDPDLTYTENLKKASELGFEVIQLWYKDIVVHSGGNYKQFIKMLKDFGLELKSLGAYTDIIDPDIPRDSTLTNFKEVIDFASDAEVRFVVTESGGVPGHLEGWDEMISRFSELADYAGSRGVTVLVENGPGVMVGSIELMARMVKELNSENIGINFDPANLVLIPDDVLKAVEQLGSYIMDTHAKDSILLQKGTSRSVPEEHIFVIPEGEDFINLPDDVTWALPPIGEGDVPFEEYIPALKKTGFTGDLIIEYQGGGNREKAIVQCKEHLEKILSQNR